MNIIKCHNLTLGYEGKEIIENIEFEVDSGDYLCIVGENGSGKSTLIKALLHIKEPMEGNVEFCGGLRANQIGYMPQQREYQSDFPASVTEVILSGRINSMHRRIFYNKDDKKALKESMEMLEIEDIANKRFTDLSGGQKQRVLLARALCAAKSVILLDEPVTGLDPMITKELYGIIDKINKQRSITVIMVSHDIDSAVKYANKILHLGISEHFFGTTAEYLVSSIGRKFLKGKQS